MEEISAIAEFSAMHNNLIAKICTITHAEVPVALCNKLSPKRKRVGQDSKEKGPKQIKSNANTSCT